MHLMLGPSATSPSPIPHGFGIAAVLDESFVLARRLRFGGLLFLLILLLAGYASWLSIYVDPEGLGRRAHFWGGDLSFGQIELLRVSLGLRFLMCSGSSLLGFILARKLWHQVRGPLPGTPLNLATIINAIVIACAIATLRLLPYLMASEVHWQPGTFVDVGPLKDIPRLSLNLLVLGIIPFFLLAPTIIAIEGGGSIRALARSTSLVARDLPRAHAIHLAFAIAVLAIAMFAWLVIAPTLGFTTEGRAWDICFSSGRVLGEALTAPLLELSLLLTYLRARVRKEGMDVEYAAMRAGLIEAGTR